MRLSLIIFVLSFTFASQAQVICSQDLDTVSLPQFRDLSWLMGDGAVVKGGQEDIKSFYQEYCEFSSSTQARDALRILVQKDRFYEIREVELECFYASEHIYCEWGRFSTVEIYRKP